jgi:hypothetical protein
MGCDEGDKTPLASCPLQDGSQARRAIGGSVFGFRRMIDRHARLKERQLTLPHGRRNSGAPAIAGGIRAPVLLGRPCWQVQIFLLGGHFLGRQEVHCGWRAISPSGFSIRRNPTWDIGFSSWHFSHTVHSPWFETFVPSDNVVIFGIIGFS